MSIHTHSLFFYIKRELKSNKSKKNERDLSKWNLYLYFIFERKTHTQSDENERHREIVILKSCFWFFFCILKHFCDYEYEYMKVENVDASIVLELTKVSLRQCLSAKWSVKILFENIANKSIKNCKEPDAHLQGALDLSLHTFNS